MGTADLKFTTWKTLFLLLLASGKRRSEMHAIDVRRIQWNEKKTKAFLYPVPGFLPKTLAAAEGQGRFQPIELNSLIPFVRNEVPDRYLCPLRALRYYLQVTVATRGPRNRLFIPYKPGCSSDLHANTVSSWVKQLILYVHKNASSEKLQVGKVRAHDTRALSASLALHQNMALPALLKTCTWASHNTFTNFYLRDVTVLEKGLHKLGPLVLAGEICKF